MATHLYVVHSGEFEVLRYSNKKQKLIDPLNTDKFRAAYKMESNQIKTYLGRKGNYRRSTIDEQNIKVQLKPQS